MGLGHKTGLSGYNDPVFLRVKTLLYKCKQEILNKEVEIMTKPTKNEMFQKIKFVRLKREFARLKDLLDEADLFLL